MNQPRLRSLLLLVLDGLLTASGLTLAFALRFGGAPPTQYRQAAVATFAIVVAVRVGAVAFTGLSRWSFRFSGLTEAFRLGTAHLCGSFAIALLAVALLRHPLPHSVLALEFFFTTTLTGGYRFLPRLYSTWRDRHVRVRDGNVSRTLIIGAGHAGDILYRDLTRTRGNLYQVIGYIDDDVGKIGTSLNGLPVLGPISALPNIIARAHITTVLIAIPRLPAEKIRAILRQSETLEVSFKIIPASFAFLDKKISAALLHDLSPEDLLPRDKVSFSDDEIERLVAGRRVLVTGAGGSIGSEIARQVSRHRPASLVLVDINENTLYFLERELLNVCPDLQLHTLVADIRDADRVERLGARFSPEILFHAAAHKHVPLMEDAPEEAIKNNVEGTLNLARMSDRRGVRDFVLISTDKAVRPSSVMGASKRVAEMVIRHVAQGSRTSFTAVRFGNVLGSAGSVVPLFKRQIKAGGPITVTHPDCTRYFMTIPEAVGLVILAGLGSHGELCVLDMGEPIRIVELASNMITMAGLVPGRDIPIVFTGLRPGEKITEELLTEEEEETSEVRDRIFVAKSPRPPVDFLERLDRLFNAAHRGEAISVKQQLRALVPTYTPVGVPHLAEPGPITPVGTERVA